MGFRRYLLKVYAPGHRVVELDSELGVVFDSLQCMSIHGAVMSDEAPSIVDAYDIAFRRIETHLPLRSPLRHTVNICLKRRNVS